MEEMFKMVRRTHAEGEAKRDLSFLSREEEEKVRAFHRSFPMYEPTPLAVLTDTAKELGVEQIYVKDESYRFGLNAFKVLGGSYAIGCCLAQRLGKKIGETGYEVLTSPETKEALGDITFVTATDGNHGRGVAWTANRLGMRSVVYMLKGSAQERLENILAEGLVVAPGFIDTHSHSDLQILVDPEVRPKVMQGITTEILGQDGISMAPLPQQYVSPWRKNLAGLDGDSDEIRWDYETTEGYLSMLENVRPGLNECYLVPHGNIRMEAMGLENRQPTEEELKKMCEITRREMEAGAIGLSTGLIYMPCAYGETNEIIEMCKIVAEYDGRFVIHQRSEADTILDSMKEVIRIGKESGVKIHYSHFKVCGKKNWDKIDDVVRLLEEAEKEGVDISFDQYPYVAGSTMLGVILPPWVHNGGTNKVIERLAEPELRKKMVYDIEHGIPGWDNFIDFAGLDQIFVTSVKTQKNQDAIGLSLTQLGELRGKNAYDATFDLLMEEENAVGMVDFYGKEEHVIRFMKRPEMNACTDGLLGGKPHPRVYGSFPRILGKYVREDKALTLGEAVYKMTGKPASAFNIKNRGVIREGAYADITVFNPETVIDKGTFTDPTQYPEGIEYVMVNGALEVKNVGEVLKEAGCGYEDIVKTTIFLTDMNQFGKVNEIYRSYFGEQFPVRSCFQVAALPLGGSVEVECIALAKEN